MFLNKFVNSVQTALLTVLLIVSFSTLAPAKPADRTSLTGVDLSQHALPDGSIPVICFGDGPPEPGHSKHCDDCVFSAANLFSGPQPEFLVAHFERQQSRLVERQFRISNIIADRPRTRAPPHI